MGSVLLPAVLGDTRRPGKHLGARKTRASHAPVTDAPHWTPATVGFAIRWVILTRFAHARRGRASWAAECCCHMSLRDLPPGRSGSRTEAVGVAGPFWVESEPARRPSRCAPSSRTWPRRPVFPATPRVSRHSSGATLCLVYSSFRTLRPAPGPFGQRLSGFPSLLSPGTLPLPTSHTAGCRPVPAGHTESKQEIQVRTRTL